MTVSTSYAPLEFAGNDATVAFSVTWAFFTGTLIVTLIDDEGTETVKTIVTHYTVTGGTDANGLPATGTVTMVTAPATGETLRVERATPLTQSTTYTNTDAFPAKSHEAALDRAALRDQEISYVASAAVQGGDLEGNAGLALVVNEDEDGFDFAEITDIIALDIGTVTTGAPGSSASATITGTPPDVLLNLTIPRGATGASGAGTGDMVAANNLSDVADVATAFATIKQAATEAATGVVELATDAETQTGTDTARAITPANLTARTATVTRLGIVELATDTEAAGGSDTTRYITPAQLHESRVDVASATTTDIGAAASNFLRITGTTAITGLGTAADGVWRDIMFSGSLVFTHGASLILPGADDITTAANDRCSVRSLGAGAWIVLHYTKASGAPITGAVTAPTKQIFTSTDTWTKPTGCQWIKVTLIGAGSGGQAGSITCCISSGGAGGNAGGGSIKWMDATGLTDETVTIGTASSGGTGNGGHSSAAGNSSFGAHVICNGGAASSATAGGTASGGDINLSAIPKNAYISASFQNAAGYGVDGPFGMGRGNRTTGVAGVGYGYGGGGGTSGTGNAGGTGGAAICIVEEFY
jgi:hypothetical protein